MTKIYPQNKIKILGAGLKGLVLSYLLKQRGVASEIYEKSERPGGWVKTCREGGFLFEAGPRGFRPAKGTLDLVASLGLEGELIYPDKAARRRFIYTGGRLRPLGYFAPRVLGALVRDLILPPTFEDLSVKDYFDRRLGSFVSSTLIDALVAGIFAGDPARLSAKLCFPSMTSRGSIVKSLWGESKGGPKGLPKEPLLSFRGGMETLIEALAKEAVIHYGATLEEPDVDCTPPKGEEYESAVVVNLGWKKLRFPSKLSFRGFGYLIPAKENEEILGVVFDSVTFPSQNGDPDEVRLTVMMGGARRRDLVESTKEEAFWIAFRAVERHLGLKEPPDFFAVHWAPKALPQPLLGSSLKAIGVNGAIEEARSLFAKIT